MYVYGFCPECHAAGVSRTRGIPCYDRCENGHKYLAEAALKELPKPKDMRQVLFELEDERNFSDESQYLIGSCHGCELAFLGHKRRRTCRKCEEAAFQKAVIAEADRLTTADARMEGLKFVESKSDTYTYEPRNKIVSGRLSNPENPFARKLYELTIDAMHEAEKASIKFPQPNYVVTKIAEESGEVIKEAIHVAEGRGDIVNLRKEIVQAMAMLMRLYIEGDQVHGVPPVVDIDLEKKRDG